MEQTNTPEVVDIGYRSPPPVLRTYSRKKVGTETNSEHRVLQQHTIECVKERINPYNQTTVTAFICLDCQAQMATSTEVSEHVTLGRSVVKFICRTCQTYFPTLSILETHEDSHVFPNMFKCSKCYESFQAGSEFKMHLKMHAMEMIDYERKPRNEKPEESVSKKPKKSSQKKQETISSDIISQDTQEPKNSKKAKQVRRKKRKSYFGDSENRAERAKKAKDRKTRQMSTETADLLTPTVELSVDENITINHEAMLDLAPLSEVPVTYGKCLMHSDCRKKGGYCNREHLHVYQQGSCRWCNITFTTWEDSQQHVCENKSGNSGEIVCKICKKKFLHRQELKAHHRLHISDRLFPCTHCKEKFSLRSQRDDHVHTAHNVTRNLSDLNVQMIKAELLENLSFEL